MIHRLAEAAEMGGDEEVAMDAGEIADRARFDEAADAADARMVAAVLDDGVQAARIPRGDDDVLRMGERVRHRLLGEEVATAPQRGQREAMARLGDHHVEDHVGLHRVDDGGGIGTDDDIVEAELGGAPLRPGDVDIDKTDDRHAIDRAQRVEPGATHQTATDEHCSQHPVSSDGPRWPQVLSFAGDSRSVNVYDGSADAIACQSVARRSI